MKTDVIIIGSELDAFVSAIRLSEHGCSVRMFNTGHGSLNYAPGGLHVLGYLPETKHPIMGNPLTEMSKLPINHPYRKLGKKKVNDALTWFSNTTEGFGTGKSNPTKNTIAITPAGEKMPIFVKARAQATFDMLDGEPVDIVSFSGHRDFPAEMLKQGLAKVGIASKLVEIEAPNQATENLYIAKAFDRLGDLDEYFSALKPNFSKKSKVVLFPSVLGFAMSNAVIAVAQQQLNRTCLEVPTLPVSVFGMRLEETLRQMLQKRNVHIQTGSRPSVCKNNNRSTVMLHDAYERPYEASAVIVATGGVMMGGLEVLSTGIVREPTFDLETYQSEPLSAGSIQRSVDALHTCGVEVDSHLRARMNGAATCPNIFVTGRSLAHWNPAAESSSEGVAIATGWAAANNVIDYLEGSING